MIVGSCVLQNEWRNCRYPFFNQEPPPEPVNLQQHSNGQLRGSAGVVRDPGAPGRAAATLDIVGRFAAAAAAAAHNRLQQPVNLHLDDREQNRHHA